MKAILNKIAAAALATLILPAAGCIEETFPTNGVTNEQLSQNSKALEGIVGGMAAYMKNYATWPISGKPQAYDFGYPAVFLALSVQTADQWQRYNGYQHFDAWQRVTVGMDPEYFVCQLNWYYLNFQVKAANDVIGVIDPATDNDYQKMALAQALAYRSSTYLDMSRIYEFLPNDKISGVNEADNDVTGLTVPFVTPEMTSEETNNNPRLPHEKMSQQLLKDLEQAADLFKSTTAVRAAKVSPDLAVVYGLMARVYMWDENYSKAAEYARLAINTGAEYRPLTSAEWLSKTDGFNNPAVPSWMWCITQESVDDQVTSTSSNWTSFLSSETGMGYAGQYGCTMNIDRRLYESIDDNDWRKLSWKAPAGSALSGQEPFINAAKGAVINEYASIKFRPAQGNLTDRSTAFATSIPLMRIEEMYLIEAEAVAHSNASQGKNLLETFMRTYRYPSYRCDAVSSEAVVDEVFLQKRIEFWGENVIFFDYKRLNKSVDRAYAGTNWPETTRFVSNGRPAWMNWPIVEFESQFNKGFEGYLNPPVGNSYTAQ